MQLGQGFHCRCIELLGAGCLGEPGMEETIKLLDKTLDQHYVRWSFEVEKGSLDSGQCKVLKKSDSNWIRQTERAGKRQGGEEDYDEGVEEQLEDEDDEDVYILSKVEKSF